MDHCHNNSLKVVLPGSIPAPSFFPHDEISPAANENIIIKADWMTPTEALQIVTRLKKKLLQENARTYSLFNSAARRKTWDEIAACEACLRWMYFRR